MVYDGFDLMGVYVDKNQLRLVAYLRNSQTSKIIRMSYPKYLMELHLNRYLNKDETVDHIDRNPLNNDISNLQILNVSEHCSLDTKRIKNMNLI